MTSHTPSVPCDPYLQWAYDSKYLGYKQPPTTPNGTRVLPLAVELKGITKINDLPASAEVPKAYQASTTEFATRFVTLTIREDEIGALLPWVNRLKLGLPSTPTLNLIEGGRISILASITVPLMAFIDNGIGFLNRRFYSTAGDCRILALWDQEETSTQNASLWTPPTGFSYGRGFVSGDLKKWLSTYGAGKSEHDLYRELDYSPCAGRAAHGTHVMDIAAGEGPVPNDPAGVCPIIAVQLPWKPFKDTSGVSLCRHILDGLRYIMSAAGKVRPVIVNISDGAYAGPQHGASLLECAMDALKTEFPNLTIVIAAGNGYEQKLHGLYSGKKRAPELAWRVLPDVKTDSFLEIWCANPKNASIEISGPGCPKVKIKLRENKILTGPKGAVGAVYTSTDFTSNGINRSLFLIALASTHARTSNRLPAPHGIWQIQVKMSKGFDAYIQRNNPALGEKGPLRQSFFLDRRVKPRYVSGNGTLNNIATGQAPVVVGGRYARGKWFDPITGTGTQVARYSSRGPGRKGPTPGPNSLFVSEDSPLLHGVLASGVRSGTRVRMDGTSVAAPAAARSLANAILAAGASSPTAQRLDLPISSSSSKPPCASTPSRCTTFPCTAR